jgi:FkbM family methyltransferase
VVCVDVGASYFAHTKWRSFLESPRTRWLAVEPNTQNTGYIQRWEWAANPSLCATGLSEFGGTQTLHVTNVDSGSSLLPPIIPDGMGHRAPDPSYFFPVTQRRIETLTLEAALAPFGETVPVVVKLDTQGTELSILRGAEASFERRRFVGIELESTLLAQPLMQGAGKFWEACAFLEHRGFELLELNPIHRPPTSGGAHRPGQKTSLNECDAVFTLRRDVARGLPVDHRMVLLGIYVTYGYYEEGESLLDDDHELAAALGDSAAMLKRLFRLDKR